MKLGTLLLRNAAISLSQLEAGLRTQVLYGGRLGTNLVELGFLDVDALTAHLGELFQLPVATSPLLDHVAPDALARIPARTAEQLGVLPLGFLAPFPDALAVAMIDPRDEAALEQLADQTGCQIAPYVVSELRALYYLERLYGLPRKARYVRPGTRRVLSSAGERRRAQPPGGLVTPPTIRLEPRRKSRELTAPPAATEAAPPLSYGAACDRIDAARHRDEIGQTLVDFGAGRFAALVVFLVRDGNALGWRAYTTAPLSRPIADLGLPIGGASSLQAATDDLRPFRGRSPAPGHPTETLLWASVGVEPSMDVFVAPVVVKQRAVNLIYAHPLAGRGFADSAVDELSELAVRASGAYVRMIKQTKGQP
ncbi:MAG: hypothetical protein HS111_38120 [Kofleriaceae bacterium]|nr:hypothetical protein [Kofleriaceae bacterium]MBE7454468.1 hypothetical protein [Kofleriaceae bacterium]MCL4228089.1 hypothetical protein [Myxococcales bacterium]